MEIVEMEMVGILTISRNGNDAEFGPFPFPTFFGGTLRRWVKMIEIVFLQFVLWKSTGWRCSKMAVRCGALNLRKLLQILPNSEK